jgi:hypothetical protein
VLQEGHETRAPIPLEQIRNEQPKSHKEARRARGI